MPLGVITLSRDRAVVTTDLGRLATGRMKPAVRDVARHRLMIARDVPLMLADIAMVATHSAAIARDGMMRVHRLGWGDRLRGGWTNGRGTSDESERGG